MINIIKKDKIYYNILEKETKVYYIINISNQAKIVKGIK